MFIVARAVRMIVGTTITCLVVASASIDHAGAQTNSPPPAVNAFLANPSALLQQYPNGGPALSNAAQEFVLADPTTFKILLGLLASANDLQKGAIGSGLAQATKIEVLTNQPLATEWQDQIAAVTDPRFKTAATNAFGDVKLGAIGGGPLGGGGGGQTGPLNQGPIGTGPVETFQAHGVPTGPFTFTSSVTPSSSTTTPPGPGPSNPVSP